MQNNIIYLLILAININSLLIGYILGRFIFNGGVSNNNQKSFLKKNNSATKNEALTINIDDKKFVTEIKTDNLEKKYESLGDIKSTSDNISSSVNKLKNLKT